MLRRGAAIAAGLLIMMPISGAMQSTALAEYVSRFQLPQPASANWLFTPGQLCIFSACLAVLALTASLRWR